MLIFKIRSYSARSDLKSKSARFSGSIYIYIYIFFFFNKKKNLCRERKRGHYERGLFTGRISRISRISKISGLSRNWSDSQLFSTIRGFSRISRISKFSGISTERTFLKRPLSKRPLFPNPNLRSLGSST